MKSFLLVIGFLFCLFHKSLQGIGWTFYNDNKCTHANIIQYHPSGCIAFDQYSSRSWWCSTSVGFVEHYWNNNVCAGTPASTIKYPYVVNTCTSFGSGGSLMVNCSYTLPPAADIAASTVVSVRENCTGPTRIASYWLSTCIWKSSTSSERLSCRPGAIIAQKYNTSTCSGRSTIGTFPFDVGCTKGDYNGCGFIPPVGAGGAPHTVVVGA